MERNIFKGENSLCSTSRFNSADSCYYYLFGIKWSGNSYLCMQEVWQHALFKGRSPYSRRCTRCKYDEIVTSGIMFDKCKFPILLALHIAFKICTNKKGMSSLELSEEYGLR